MSRLLLVELRVWLMTLAHVALNACVGGFSLANRIPSRLLQFGSERWEMDELHVETHMFERRAVAGLANRADLIVMRVGAHCWASGGCVSF